MLGILDRVSAEWHSRFQPQNATEYLALHLAQKLGEPAAAQHYLLLLDQHGDERVLAAYRRTIAQGPSPAGLPHIFHLALAKVNGNGHVGEQVLMAVKVERRSVAVAIFNDVHLDYTQARQLSSDRGKIEQTVAGFLSRMFDHFKIEAAALEAITPNAGEQRLAVDQVVASNLRSRGLTLARVDKDQLVGSYGHPSPRSRPDMRAVVRGIWPVLGTNGGILDAVALGLHVQTERLLSSTT